MLYFLYALNVSLNFYGRHIGIPQVFTCLNGHLE